jgi:large subunit ribosomal protein L3
LIHSSIKELLGVNKMAIGIVGIKRGMTRVFTEEGESLPVTVIEATPNRITQVKTAGIDGYSAIQVTKGSIKSSRVNKPRAGHFAKANVEAGRKLWEFRIGDETELNVGDSLTVEGFEAGERVDVSGHSKGKGFAGVIKRHNFKMQDATHGNSISHRAPGSIGQCQTPGRVFKGKKMAGHMGARQVTIQTLEIVRVDNENNLLLVKGAVPGANGGDVIVTPAVKAVSGDAS